MTMFWPQINFRLDLVYYAESIVPPTWDTTYLLSSKPDVLLFFLAFSVLIDSYYIKIYNHFWKSSPKNLFKTLLNRESYGQQYYIFNVLR